MTMELLSREALPYARFPPLVARGIIIPLYEFVYLLVSTAPLLSQQYPPISQRYQLNISTLLPLCRQLQTP